MFIVREMVDSTEGGVTEGWSIRRSRRSPQFSWRRTGGAGKCLFLVPKKGLPCGVRDYTNKLVRSLRRRPSGEAYDIYLSEINLRMGGTTHPYLALQFLTGGQLDPASGLFRSSSGQTKYYRATDNLHGELYRGLLPEDLIEILTINKLHYSHATERGVLFHLIGALSQFGKVGLTAIASSPEEVDDLYQRTLTVIDREANIGRHRTPDAGLRGPI